MAEPELKLTETDVTDWIGSDIGWREVIEILTNIANGDYKPTELKRDIKGWDTIVCPQCTESNLTEDKSRCWNCDPGE